MCRDHWDDPRDVLGQTALNLSVTARGRLSGYLLRDGYECGTRYKQIEGHFTADGTDFASRVEEMSGCTVGRLLYERRVDETFQGTGQIRAKKPGTSFDLVGAVKARLYAKGQARSRMRTSGNADLKFEKLELTITNPGNEGTSSSLFALSADKSPRLPKPNWRRTSYLRPKWR